MKVRQQLNALNVAFVGFILLVLVLCPMGVKADDTTEYIESIKIQLYNLDNKLIYEKTFVFETNDLDPNSDTTVLLGADFSDQIYSDQQIDHMHIKLTVKDDYSNITTFRTLVRIDDDLNSKVLYYTSNYHYDWTLEYTYSEYEQIRRSDEFVIYVSDKNGERISEFVSLYRKGSPAAYSAQASATPSPSPSPTPTATLTPTEQRDWAMPEGGFPSQEMESTSEDAQGLGTLMMIVLSVVALVLLGSIITLVRKPTKKRISDSDPKS